MPSIHRCEMLASIRDSLPELYPVCYSAYSRPSILFIGSHIESQGGPQQGPLLFCNCWIPLRSTLTLGYLNDVTLGSPQDEVGSDVSRIIEVGQSSGLQLDAAKCEVVTHPGTAISDPTRTLYRCFAEGLNSALLPPLSRTDAR